MICIPDILSGLLDILLSNQSGFEYRTCLVYLTYQIPDICSVRYVEFTITGRPVHRVPLYRVIENGNYSLRSLLKILFDVETMETS